MTENITFHFAGGRNVVPTIIYKHTQSVCPHTTVNGKTHSVCYKHSKKATQSFMDKPEGVYTPCPHSNADACMSVCV